MKKNLRSIVSVDELDALIKDWGQSTNKLVDKWYPARFYFLAMIVIFYAFALLFSPSRVAATLTSDPLELHRLTLFLYYRGWFLMVVGLIGGASYLRDRYVGLVCIAFLLVGTVNLVSDVFNVYFEIIGKLDPKLTFVIILRLTALYFVFLNFKNCHRIPVGTDKLNPFLPFKKSLNS